MGGHEPVLVLCTQGHGKCCWWQLVPCRLPSWPNHSQPRGQVRALHTGDDSPSGASMREMMRLLLCEKWRCVPRMYTPLLHLKICRAEGRQALIRQSSGQGVGQQGLPDRERVWGVGCKGILCSSNTSHRLL